MLPHQDAEYVNHIALDIGGSLIKLVYFSTDPSEAVAASPSSPQPAAPTSPGAAEDSGSATRGGKRQLTHPVVWRLAATPTRKSRLIADWLAATTALTLQPPLNGRLDMPLLS